MVLITGGKFPNLYAFGSDVVGFYRARRRFLLYVPLDQRESEEKRWNAM